MWPIKNPFQGRKRNFKWLGSCVKEEICELTP